MTLEQYGLYQYACDVSYASGKFYLSGPKAAMEFAKTGKNTIYRVGQQLVNAGWFKVLTPRYRDGVTGMWRPMVIKPLTHKEWKQCHPDAVCPAPPERQSVTEVGQSMTDSGHGTMTENVTGTMTDFESSMTVLEGIHDRNREQVLEVSREVSESVGAEQDSRAQMISFQMAEKECGRDQKNQDQNPIPRRLIKEPEASACRPRTPEKLATLPGSPDRLSRLATCLYDIGRGAGAKQAFSGANLTKLGVMLHESSEDEIVEAWREHLEGCTDPFLLKQAVNSFSQGSGRTIIDSQRQRAREELERDQEERAKRESRLQSSIGRQAEREMFRQEDCVREEYNTWLDHHDEDENFTPSNQEAFERYQARDEYKSAREAGISFADQWPFERRVKELERAAIKGLMADPTIIAAAGAEFAKAA